MLTVSQSNACPSRIYRAQDILAFAGGAERKQKTRCSVTPLSVRALHGTGVRPNRTGGKSENLQHSRGDRFAGRVHFKDFGTNKMSSRTLYYGSPSSAL